MKKQRPFHPVLFAAFPVLSLFAVNLDYVYLSDLWRPLAVMAAVAAAMWFVVSRFTKEAARAAVGVSLFLAVMFFIGYFKSGIETGMAGTMYLFLSVPSAVLCGVLLGRRVKTERWRLPATIGLVCFLLVVFSFGLAALPLADRHLLRIGWMLLAILAGVFGARVKAGIEPLTALLNWIGIILVVQPLVAYGIASIGSGTETPAIRMEGISGAQEATSTPDIYYFVLDGYGREDTLRELFGLPNDALAAGLRERGFYVADKSLTNYTQTWQAVGATLNMEYVQSLIDVDPGEESRENLKNLTNRNRVTELLKSMGYEYISVVTQKRLLPTESAHFVLEDSHGRSLLEEALIAKTPFGGTMVFTSGANSHRQRILGVYRNLDALRPISKPRFVLVHVVSPHPPFVFYADGSFKDGGSDFSDGSHYIENGGTLEEYVDGYREQAKFIAERTLQSIDRILKRSSKRPIIIVQGDHGPKSELDYESLERTNLDEVLPILNAYLVPEEIENDLYAEVSPVNTFRILFRHLFGADYETLPDRSYYSTWSHPYRFIEVELK